MCDANGKIDGIRKYVNPMKLKRCFARYFRRWMVLKIKLDDFDVSHEGSWSFSFGCNKFTGLFDRTTFSIQNNLGFWYNFWRFCHFGRCILNKLNKLNNFSQLTTSFTFVCEEATTWAKCVISWGFLIRSWEDIGALSSSMGHPHLSVFFQIMQILTKFLLPKVPDCFFSVIHILIFI